MLADNEKKNGGGKDDQPKKKDEELAKKNEGKGDANKDDQPPEGAGAAGTSGKGSDKKDNTIASQKLDIWGHLPENRRKEMQVFQRERFMPRYEELLREYYRSLAEGRR